MKNRILQLVWLFPILFLISNGLSAQTSDSSTDWLKVKFGETEAEAIIQAGGEKLELYLFIAENGAQVHNVAPKDVSEYPDALDISPVNSDVLPLTEEALLEGNFNSELYNFERANNAPTYYRVGDSGYLVIIESYEQLRTKFQNQQ